MGLGEDIAEVYDLGSSVTIVNRVPIITGGKILYDINTQSTKPFVQEHQLDATFPYNTVIVSGDVLNIMESGFNYMVMNKTPEMFEDEIVEWSVVLYKCNLPATTHILRPVEVRNSQTKKMTEGWNIIYDSPIYGLLTDRIAGSALQEDSKAGQFLVWKLDLYVPKSYELKPLDRLIVHHNEFYKVDRKQGYSFPEVDVWMLVEDTRPRSTVLDEELYLYDEY